MLLTLAVGLALLSVILLLLCIYLVHKSRSQLALVKEEATKAQTLALQGLQQTHTQELQQVEARTQQEMERFRSDLSHSLRMPVSVVQGYAELLAGDMVADAGVKHEYLTKLIARTGDISAILTRQLAEARSDDALLLTTAPTDLLPLINQVVADLKMPALQRGITIQVICTEPQVVADVDAYHITKVLFNLIENSLKYMGREGRINIAILSLEGSVHIKVKDDGLGLPPDEVEHIFKPNYQGSNRTTGHGQGLHLCKQTIEAHGGTITATSQRGRGMGTTIILPTALVPVS